MVRLKADLQFIGQPDKCSLVIQSQAASLTSYCNDSIQCTTVQTMPTQTISYPVGDGALARSTRAINGDNWHSRH
jgi:hypothetical protein